MSDLRIKFRKRDTPYGVTRETLKAIAEQLDVSEAEAIHLALALLAMEVLPGYERDDRPLSKDDLDFIRKLAQPMLPKGKLIRTRSLLS